MNLCILDLGKKQNMKNNIFNPSAYSTYGNDLGFPFRVLKEKFLQRGHNLDTIDIRQIESFDGFIFIEMPKNDNLLSALKNTGKPLYLIIFECPALLPRNWDVTRHSVFSKIFTWNPEMPGDKYIHFLWPNNLSVRTNYIPFDKKEKLLSIFTARKWCLHRGELYTERQKAIEWFENFHKEDLDLYGPGWSPSIRKNIKEHILNLNRIIFGRQTRPWRWAKFEVHRGYAPSKIETLKRYKFSLCYENATGFPGYISEKIFDCFIARTVPVYLGWAGAKDYIPENCFINKGNFSTYEELYKFITSMSGPEYAEYIEAISKFLESPVGNLFDAHSFGENVAKNVIADIITAKNNSALRD